MVEESGMLTARHFAPPLPIRLIVKPVVKLVDFDEIVHWQSFGFGVVNSRDLANVSP